MLATKKRGIVMHVDPPTVLCTVWAFIRKDTIVKIGNTVILQII